MEKATKLKRNTLENVKNEHIFLIFATLFIGIMIYIMPLNRVPDESTHAVNAWKTVYVKQKDSFDWRASIGQYKEIDRETYHKVFSEKINLSKEKVRFRINKNTVQYIPQILGMLVGKLIYPSIGIIMTFGRIMNALFYVLSLYFIIKYLKYGEKVLIFISLLPISIQQAASLSYDVANFIAISFFFAVTSNLVTNSRLRLKDILLLLFSVLGLYFTKINNLSLLMLLPFINLKLSKSHHEWDQKVCLIQKKYKKILLIFSVLVILFLSILFFRTKGGVIHFIQIMLNSLLNNSINQALNPVVSAGMFGFIGIFHIQFPLWLFFIDISVLTILMISSFNENKYGWPFKDSFIRASSWVFPLQVILVIGGMYFSWTPKILGENAQFSTGAQGRYFTPFLVYFTPLFIKFNHNINGRFNRSSVNKLLCITILSNFIVTIYLILIVYWYPEYQYDWLIELKKMIL